MLAWTPVLDTAEESLDSAPTHQVESVAGVVKYATGGIVPAMERFNAEEAKPKAAEMPTPVRIEARTMNMNIVRCLPIRRIKDGPPAS
jgi:hypothetical protein